MRKLITFSVLLLLSLNQLFSQLWMDSVNTVIEVNDLMYGTATNFNGGTDTLTLDLFLPDCNSPSGVNRPLMIWIHGGAFLVGNKEDPSIRYMCMEFAKRGYVTASINYRLGFVSDDLNWQCNYPDYNCVFAADSAEWVRAYYRGVQDGKGALAWLVNNASTYRIDTGNIFLAGESAGAFIALGVGLMDTTSERPVQTYATSDVALPHPNAQSCVYNQNRTFTGPTIPRPDLGGIEGPYPQPQSGYTIKGIGNMFGGMYMDLLRDLPAGKPKPAIYSFHRPCDMIVPIDSNFVYWGLSWCFTNGYGCYGVANNRVKIYGARAFSNWNTNNSYGYNIQDEFGTTNFPYSWLGPASCTDQINNPCHAYDSRILREDNLAAFFAGMVTTTPCVVVATEDPIPAPEISVYPNPADHSLTVKSDQQLVSIALYDALGREVKQIKPTGTQAQMDVSGLRSGVYFLHLTGEGFGKLSKKVLIQ